MKDVDDRIEEMRRLASNFLVGVGGINREDIAKLCDSLHEVLAWIKEHDQLPQ
jgi:hypothetical protein